MDVAAPPEQKEPRRKPVAPATPAPLPGAEDYATSAVPRSARSPAWNIALVRMGFTVSATDLLFGMSLGLFFGFWTAVAVALVASLLISAVSVACGLIGQREGLTTALVARLVFGSEGARLPALLLALVSVGFAGYSTGITASVLPGESTAALIAYCVGLTLFYTLVSSLGFERGLTWIGRISVPLMVAAVSVAVVSAVGHAGGLGSVLAAEPARAGEAGVAAMIALGTAKWMTGATLTSDITRFAGTARAVYLTTFAEFVVGNFGFNLLGIVLGLAVGVDDLGAAFAAVGVGVLAVVAIFIQGFPHEVNNLYAGGLAASSALDAPRVVVNAASGLVAAALAFYGASEGILDSFLEYLGHLAYAIPLIPGILLADYFLLQRAGHRRVSDAPRVNRRAIGAFAVGLGVNLYLGLVLDDLLVRSLPVIGAALYLAFSFRQVTAAWRGPAGASVVREG